MTVTKNIAENCVSYLQERGYSAYTYKYNNTICVYIVIEDMDLELSENEIINRHELFLAELS